MVGAYIGFALTSIFGFSFLPALLIAMLVCGILGVIIEKVAYKPLRGGSRISALITAIAVSLFLRPAAHRDEVQPIVRTQADLREGLSHQRLRQAQLDDGVLAVQPKAFAHQRNIALLRVALKVWGRVYADGGFGVLEIRQTYAGNDAVAQRHIGALRVGGRGFRVWGGLGSLRCRGRNIRRGGLHLRGGGILRRILEEKGVRFLNEFQDKVLFGTDVCFGDAQGRMPHLSMLRPCIGR